MDIVSEENESPMDTSSIENISIQPNTQSNSKKSKKRKISTPLTSPKQQREKQYNIFRRKLSTLLPGVFNKTSIRGEYIFNLFCDIIRINNLIDADDDITKVDLLITEQRIMRALNNLFKRDTAVNANNNNIENARLLLNSYMSPYKEQFKEISPVGSGAFGEVYKSVHLLDEMNYAIKKIKLKGWDIKMILKSLEEVKTLAKLNHINVVTYKQAWIETVKTEDIGPSQSSSRTASRNSSYLDVINNDNDAFFKTIESKCKSLTLNTGKSSRESSESLNESQMILYIQMSLCDKSLRQWMDGRIERSPLSVIEKIASQILCGLSYIHNLKVVHHDINPNNIFISEISGELQIKIGDFGLACISQKELHSQDLGTPLYVAPEQLNKECNPKSDIYGFGIILFELLIPMGSWMERCKKVESFKNGQVPDELSPEWIHLLKMTLHENPDKRASAEHLLEYLKTNNDIRIANLQAENDKLRDENSMLQMQIKKYEDEKKLYIESHIISSRLNTI